MKRFQMFETVREYQRGASVADQLAFDRWPDRDKVIARMAVALEIEEDAKPESEVDDMIDEARLRIEVAYDALRKAWPALLKGDELATKQAEDARTEFARGITQLREAIEDEGPE